MLIHMTLTLALVLGLMFFPTIMMNNQQFAFAQTPQQPQSSFGNPQTVQPQSSVSNPQTVQPQSSVSNPQTVQPQSSVNNIQIPEKEQSLSESRQSQQSQSSPGTLPKQADNSCFPPGIQQSFTSQNPNCEGGSAPEPNCVAGQDAAACRNVGTCSTTLGASQHRPFDQTPACPSED
jgi:hypothetical protein